MSIIKAKSYSLALHVTRLYKHLSSTKKEYVLSKQVLRSATSVGANVRESQNAQSKADFVHKLSIAQKEADETLYWLELLLDTEFLSKKEFDSIYDEAHVVYKMITRIIISTKRNMKKH